MPASAMATLAPAAILAHSPESAGPPGDVIGPPGVGERLLIVSNPCCCGWAAVAAAATTATTAAAIAVIAAVAAAALLLHAAFLVCLTQNFEAN